MATTGRYYYKTYVQPNTINIGENVSSFSTPVTFTSVYQEDFPGTVTLQNQQQVQQSGGTTPMYQFANCQLFDANTNTATAFPRPAFQNVQDEITFNQDMEQLKLILTDQIPLPPMNGNGSTLITPPLSPQNDQMLYYQQQSQQQQSQKNICQGQNPIKSEYFSIKYRPRKRSFPKQTGQETVQSMEHVPQQTEYIIDTPLFKEVKQENMCESLATEEPVPKRPKKALRSGKFKNNKMSAKNSQTHQECSTKNQSNSGNVTQISQADLEHLQQPIKNSQKRSAHLSAEFRYRTKLNDKICRLRSLVGQRVHLSKSAVLTKSIERIVKLQKLAIRLHESNNRLMVLLSKYVLDPVDRRALEQQANTFGALPQTPHQQQSQQPPDQQSNKLMSIKELTKSLSSKKQQQQQKQHTSMASYSMPCSSPALSSKSLSSPVSSVSSSPSLSSTSFNTPILFPASNKQQANNHNDYSSTQNDLFPMDMDRLLEDTCLLGDLDAVLFSNTQTPLSPSDSGSTTSQSHLMNQRSIEDDHVFDDHFDLESLLAQF